MTSGSANPLPRRVRRRWMRFSLRTLLVVVAIAAIFPGRALYRAERQRRAVAHVLWLGGSIQYEHEHNDSGHDPNGKPPGPQWLVRLFGIDVTGRVDSAYVHGDRHSLTDSDLLCLEPLSGAEVVRIGSGLQNSDQVSDDGLSVLQRFQSVRTLSLLRLVGTTNDCLAHLRSLRNLRELAASGNSWNGDGFRYLTALPLESVNLKSRSITDECLIHLGQITTLKTLYLENTGITDAGLAHLAGLHNLEELPVGCTQVGDEGVKHLFGLKKLRMLHIFNTNLTIASAESLANALPECEIAAPFGYHYDDGRGWQFWKSDDAKGN